jgi:hypothetical protein
MGTPELLPQPGEIRMHCEKVDLANYQGAKGMQSLVYGLITAILRPKYGVVNTVNNSKTPVLCGFASS